MPELFGLTMILIAAFGVVSALCGVALGKAAALGDAQERRMLMRQAAKERVQRRYWRRRYPDGWWPGKDGTR